MLRPKKFSIKAFVQFWLAMCSLKVCTLITPVFVSLMIHQVKSQSTSDSTDWRNIANPFKTATIPMGNPWCLNHQCEQSNNANHKPELTTMCGRFSGFFFPQSRPGLVSLRGGYNSHSVDIDQTTRDNIVIELINMGASRQRAEAVAYLSGAFDAEDAMQWLIEHLDDPRIDMPIEVPGQEISTPGEGDSKDNHSHMEDSN